MQYKALLETEGVTLDFTDGAIDKIEQDLMQVIPQKEWTFVGHALIWHGRRVCSARKPNCEECILEDFCPSSMSAFPEPWTDDSNVIFRTSGYTHIDGGFNAMTI